MTENKDRRILPKPFSVIGHRGAAGQATENSVEAFEIAFASGVDAIELDVKYLHGQLVVFHDDTVERLTNGSGNVAALTRRQLDELRLPNGEPIPTLADVWDITPPSVAINVELKGPGTAAPLVEFSKSHSHEYLISSLRIEELKILKSLAPEMPSALLTFVRELDVVSVAASIGVDNIHVRDSVADLNYMQPMLDAGFATYVFTVNDRQRATELCALGVSAIFTDLPIEFTNFDPAAE